MAFRDPVVQRFSWSRNAPPYTEADARAYCMEQERARLRGDPLNFAFVEPAGDDDVLGGGSLYDVDLEQSRAAVGYWLAPGVRGRGVRPTPSGYWLDGGILSAGSGLSRADMRPRQ